MTNCVEKDLFQYRSLGSLDGVLSAWRVIVWPFVDLFAGRTWIIGCSNKTINTGSVYNSKTVEVYFQESALQYTERDNKGTIAWTPWSAKTSGSEKLRTEAHGVKTNFRALQRNDRTQNKSICSYSKVVKNWNVKQCHAQCKHLWEWEHESSMRIYENW